MAGIVPAGRIRSISSGTFTALVLLLVVQSALGQSQYPPVFRSNWYPISTEGFGDRQNSWAWSMIWFKGKLLVGTARAEDCVTAESAHQLQPSTNYPPNDPQISCAPNYFNLPLQAEIWSYDPPSKTWTRVYQSPLTVPVPGTNPIVMVPPDIGFRGMSIFNEPDGTEALYVGGCSSSAIFPGVPGGRLLRSTDGVNFAPVPQTAGTFLGNLGNACFRGQQSLNGQFFIMAVDWKGQGTVLQSANPKLGDNSFQEITSPLTLAYEIAVFKNQLYVTFVNSVTGFSVARTDPTGPSPYTYTTVLPNGGYRTPYPNPIALSMQAYDGYLYVGGDGVRNGPQVDGTQGSSGIPLSDQGAELFRIHADDTWDLISGVSRSTPAGQKYSLSGLDVGFSWYLNQHMWRMTVFDGRLYIGTYDESTELRNTKQGSQTPYEFGFDLWWTQDGTYFSQVDQQGFEDPFNIGVRSIAVTPYGLFLGSANPYYGLIVYQGVPTGMGPPSGANSAEGATSAATVPDPPRHVQAEGGQGGALLSWDPPDSGVKRYHVFRQSYQAIDPKEIGVGSNGPAYVRSAWLEIGVSEKPIYQDATASLDGRYAYQVKAEDEQGLLSEYSNFVAFPSEATPLTFADARESLSRLAREGKFREAAKPDRWTALLQQAEAEAANGQFGKLLALWGSWKNTAVADFRDPIDARELELTLSRLSKRAQLVQAGLLAPAALAATVPATTNISNSPNLNCTGTPLICPQPTSGPEGNNYPYGSVTVNGPYWANNRYLNNNVEYYIYEPGTPTPPKAPVILFLHGYGAFTPANYQALIYQMVLKGFTVVWAAYQGSITSIFANYPSNAQAAWTDALYRLENYTWEPHVKPYKVNGVIQTIIVGHSFGGWISAWLAGQASTSIPSFPVPLGLVMIEPASLGLLPSIDFSGVSPATKMLIVSGDQDNVACSLDAVNIFTSTTQVPASQKNYLFFNSDNSGTPNQVGNHYFPNTDGYDDTAAVDNRDFYVTYKLSVSAAQCMFLGNNCDVFLGNGGANQLSMGHWTNGTPVTTMSYYADPTKLPPIPGCP